MHHLHTLPVLGTPGGSEACERLVPIHGAFALPSGNLPLTNPMLYCHTAVAQGYKYSLLRPVTAGNVTTYATIVQVGGVVDMSNAISVPVFVPGQTWVLWVSSEMGHPFTDACS